MAIIDPPLVNKLMLVPEQNTFIGSQPGSALVIHKTASGTSAEAVANFFINDPARASSHFIIGQDREIVQCAHLVNGAGANCCVETGDNPYWNTLLQQFGNLNRCTISIEHVDSASDNSTPLTAAQQASSFKLIKWLVDQYGFDITPDGHGQMVDVKGHNTIDPINRARCPGNYPWSELQTYLQGGGTMGVPAGWTDNGTTLTAPNGHKVVHGFRAKVLAGWDPADIPLEEEHQVAHVENYYASDAGAIQTFNYTRLCYTVARGVYKMGIGNELLGCEKALVACKAAAPVTTIQGIDPVKVKTFWQTAAAKAADLETFITSSGL